MTLFSAPSGFSGYQKPTNRTVGRDFQSVGLLAFVSFFLLVGLGSRLAYLQVVAGATNRQRADENRIRLIPKPPERGRILDRNGKVLATSKISFSVYVWPLAIKDPSWPQTRSSLSQILKKSEADITKIMSTNAQEGDYRVNIARNINDRQVVALEELRRELKGVNVDPEPIRYYPNGYMAAHLLGYTGEVTPDNLKSLRNKQGKAPTEDLARETWIAKRYRLGDVIGKAGVEAAYETDLRGGWGGKQVEVDASGEIIKVVGEKSQMIAKDIRLSLDQNLQQVAETALGQNLGGIVALEAQTGAVLAMVSRPAFDPNTFSKPITEKVWTRLQGEDHPLINRVIGSSFPPASTFKIVTASAGLESGNFTTDTVLNTFGAYYVGGISFGEWNHAGFGPLGFVGALKWSSDTFFYQVAHKMGDKPLVDWSRRYGFGKHTGIELRDEEDPGLVPDPDWFKKASGGSEWTIGNTINMSIGQGDMLATPLQVALMFGVPATNGYLLKPHLRNDLDPKKYQRTSLKLKPSTLDTIKQGLREVVNGGTGAVMDSPTIPHASGKTGTAEAPPRESHTWFGSYAPSEKPEIIVVAFGEHSGGGGGKFCAPMVLKVMEAYFNAKAGKPVPLPSTSASPGALPTAIAPPASTD
jgi:penicillin-binding protein 2